VNNLIIPNIISQHAEEASFLWLLRNNAVHEPHYSLKDLAKLDNRVEAHIDGLRVAGDDGWNICKEALAWKEEGELFTAAVLAFESGNDDRIQEVLKAGTAEPGLSRGIISALGWLDYSISQNHIQTLLDSESPDLRLIGIAASAVHRKDPGKYLSDAIADGDPRLKDRALRAAGELGRKDLLPFISTLINDKDDNCRFWASWSAAVLGDVSAVSALKDQISSKLPQKQAEDAVKLALRQMDISSALSWQKELSQNPRTLRLSLTGAGVMGDPALIPFMIEYMKAPEQARVAGEAFTMITGADLAFLDLEGEKPEGFEPGPTENPEDEDVAMDPDEDLPWPNHELVLGWWNRNRNQFNNGNRYLTGKQITAEHLQQVLRSGRQRQRAAAALELVIMRPGQPLFEVRAQGIRQQKILGLK